MRSLFLATILFLFSFPANAGFPEGENGYDLKKIEESFRLPCDENIRSLKQNSDMAEFKDKSIN